MDRNFQPGDRVVFHGQNPYWDYHGVVVSTGQPDPGRLDGRLLGVRVRWDGDVYFPEKAGTETVVGSWNHRFEKV